MNRNEEITRLKLKIASLERELEKLEATQSSESGLFRIDYEQIGRGKHKYPTKRPWILKLSTTSRGDINKVAYKEVLAAETLKEVRSYLLALAKEASGFEAILKESENE